MHLTDMRSEDCYALQPSTTSQRRVRSPLWMPVNRYLPYVTCQLKEASLYSFHGVFVISSFVFFIKTFTRLVFLSFKSLLIQVFAFSAVHNNYLNETRIHLPSPFLLRIHYVLFMKSLSCVCWKVQIESFQRGQKIELKRKTGTSWKRQTKSDKRNEKTFANNQLYVWVFVNSISTQKKKTRNRKKNRINEVRT